MSEQGNGKYPPPPGWPNLHKKRIELSRLPNAPTSAELARAYADVAAGYHEQMPAIVDALEFLRGMMTAMRAEVAEMRLGPMREKEVSVRDIVEETMEETGRHYIPPPPAIPTESDRVSKAVANALNERSAKFYGAVVLAVVVCLLTGIIAFAAGSRQSTIEIRLASAYYGMRRKHDFIRLAVFARLC